MRPLSLKLKGFKGIRSNSGIDMLELDLSACNGLTAIVGPNGSGKTTILDNLHPYRIMPYRSGSYSPRSFSYYGECYGTEALKELVFELGGKKYKSLLLINAEKRKQEAYLFEASQDKWHPLCDGKVDNYDTVVNDLVGLPQLFFISVFRCQDALKLSDYTKGEMKDIFVELLGIELLKQKGQKAKEIKESLLRQVSDLSIQSTSLNEIVQISEKAEIEAQEIEKTITLLKAEILHVEKEQEKSQKLVQSLKIEMAVEKEREKTRNDLDLRFQEIQKQASSLRRLLEKSNEVKEAELTELNVVKEIEKERQKQEESEAEGAKLQEQVSSLKNHETEYIKKERALSELKLMRKHRFNSVKSELSKAKNSSELLKNVPCSLEIHNKCLLLKDAVAASKSIPKLIIEAHNLQKTTEQEIILTREIESLKEKAKSITTSQNNLADAMKSISQIKKSLNNYEGMLSKARELSKLLPEIELAEKRSRELDLELKNIKSQIASLAPISSNLRRKVEEELKNLDRYALKKKEILATEYQLAQQLGSKNAAVKQGSSSKMKISAISKEVDEVNANISDWAILEKAFSKDGIIALEIDDAGPSISAIANDLLYTCFGPRFSVRIDTQVTSNNGKGLKETFDIIAFDSIRNESKSLRSMSGGEKVWIEESITRAISLFNSQKSKIRYQTLFTDEKDGSLDSQKKKEFIEMKKKVLLVGGYDTEFFISQSPEIQEQADNVIDISEKN